MITRHELYELVWSEPMTKVAHRFNVSGSYMARVCTVLNVPRPGRGYWAKLAVGKAPEKPPLPDALPGDLLHWSNDFPGTPIPRPQRPQASRRNHREKSEKPARIARSEVHLLLQGVRPLFERTREVGDRGYLKPYKQLIPDIATSPGGLEHALTLASDLYNAFATAGHRVVIASTFGLRGRADIDEREVVPKHPDRYRTSIWSPLRPTLVYIGDVPIGLAVIEMSEPETLRYLRGKYVRESDCPPIKASRHNSYDTWTVVRDLPSGRFGIMAYSPYWQAPWSKIWQDTKQQQVRSKFTEIVKHVEGAAALITDKLVEAERLASIEREKRRIEEEQRKRELDQQRIEQSFTDSTKHLSEVIDRWAELSATEQFLSGVKERAHSLPEPQRQAVMQRLVLARELLGPLDPFEHFQAWKSPEERYTPLYP